MAKPVLYDDEGNETPLPTIKVVCPSCDGRGTTTAHVECDGGGFTGSEWRELDEDFREGYMSGRYDRACPECHGQNVVDQVDYDRLTPEQCDAWEKQRDAEARDRAEAEAERRAGC